MNDSTYVQVGWFDDGMISYAGYLVNGEKQGKWRYFHHNGQVSVIEFYVDPDLEANSVLNC